ncbi:hypothetical protein [Halalkalicoccus jeotgali]|uniref:Uncharacterized protein n=1 Tax=Halalkalicoccus jeotgali (strain DSM 18796 / CECT 7217 / JCM 14584 / KCTC 4019 / B3) TaxID=795797 RepID=L9VVW3_HALJB|nr:hypothetical protein [Halalkalicoccus jeotgali]ELY41156.1 hypothetical protein C497_01922 [Halalkalicoccus jeotgali B3]
MVADIITSIGSPAIGGIIAAVAGWQGTKWDREKNREAKKKQWYMSLFRLSQELNTSPTTALFMELGTDQQRLIQQFEQIASQLDQERYRAPADIEPGLIAALVDTATNANRLRLDRNDFRTKLDHHKMLMFAEELHYYIQSELGDDTPIKFDQERMDRIEDQIATREEMDPTEWRAKVASEMADKWAEDSEASEGMERTLGQR